MKMTAEVSRILAYRRAVRKLKKQDFENVELYRNRPAWNKVITDVVIGPDKTTLWWKQGTRDE
jgi:hypothetical protein